MSSILEEIVAELVAVAGDPKRLDPFPSELSCVHRSPLVDRALGMMGYNVGTVYPRAEVFRIETLASILSSSTFHGEPPTCACEQASGIPEGRRCVNQECSCGEHTDTLERVEFGTCVSRDCIERVAESCKLFLLHGRGSLVLPLIEALLKATTELSSFRKVEQPSSYGLYRRSPGTDTVPEAVTDLLELLRREKLYQMLAPVSRACAWRLNPKLLKLDLAEMVSCALEQPELALEYEFHNRAEWKSIVTSMSMFPVSLAEGCRLLETWSSSLTFSSRIIDLQKLLSELVQQTQVHLSK